MTKLLLVLEILFSSSELISLVFVVNRAWCGLYSLRTGLLDDLHDCKFSSSIGGTGNSHASAKSASETGHGCSFSGLPQLYTPRP